MDKTNHIWYAMKLLLSGYYNVMYVLNCYANNMEQYTQFICHLNMSSHKLNYYQAIITEYLSALSKLLITKTKTVVVIYFHDGL